MQIDPNAPRKARTIGGLSVTVPQPYHEGYTLTEAEAAMLNQTFAENISNNMRAKSVDDNGDPLAEDAFQALVDEYVTKYEPGVRQGGGGGGAAAKLSPVELEVRNLATAKLKEILKQRGLKQKDIEFVAVRDQIIEQHNAALTAQAEKIVRAREKASGGDDDIFASVAASLPGVGEEAPAEAA